jgi:S-adenosylhomocysteine hydrolase/8-oxo-dGTP pyrophosphatase MutT (NUDIX family)
MPITNQHISHVVNAYLSIYPKEQENLRLLLDQLSKTDQLVSRKNFVGHITASGFVLDKSRRKVVLIKHISLDKFLQPGGHVEIEDTSLLQAAIREIKEETGLQRFSNVSILSNNPEIPLDINSHFIPENLKKGEPSHFHHDFRFCFILEDDSFSFEKQEEEVSECKMVDLSKLMDIVQFADIYKKIRNLSIENKPAKFFNEVVGDAELNTATQSIIVTHILQDRPVLIKALDRISNVGGIVPKPNSIDEKTLNELSENFTIIRVTKDDLKDISTIKDYISSLEKPVVLLDIGGYFAPIINDLSDIFGEKLLGVVEDTENGHQKYLAVKKLKVPVISVARSYLKENEDYLVGQSVVFSTDSVLRGYNRLLSFMNCGVLGYGKVGKSIALNLQKTTVKPMVWDTTPSKRVRAINDGSTSPDRDILLSTADVIFCATGNKSLDILDFRKLKNGCFIASVTSSDDEFNFDYLESEYEKKEVAPYVTKYTNTANYFYILNAGNAINFIHGAVVGDFIFLVQSEILAGVKYLSSNTVKPGLHELPDSIKEELAEIWLRNFS